MNRCVLTVAAMSAAWLICVLLAACAGPSFAGGSAEGRGRTTRVDTLRDGW